MPGKETATPDHASRGNPRAVQARIEIRRAGAYEGQRRHDMRTGAQPRYVDKTRAEENDVLIEPPRPGVLRDWNDARRSRRETQRAMRKDAAAAVIGIITFGAEAADTFRALTREKQNEAFRDAAEAIAEHLGTTLAGLVVHRDETSPHAHFTLPAYDIEGRPLSKVIKRTTLAQVQTITADAMKRHAPTIERGRRVSERAAAGADDHALRHRSVRELHADLPAEVAAARAEAEAAKKRADEMRGRVNRLEAQAELTKAELKRLDTYRKRLEDRVKAEEAAKAEAERIAARMRDVAAAAAKAAKAARADVDAARAEATAAREDAAQARREVIRLTAQAETVRAEAQRDAAAVRAEAAEVRAEAEAARAEATGLRDTLKRVIGSLRHLAKRAGLTGSARITVSDAIKDAEALLTEAAPAPAQVRPPEPEDDSDRPGVA